MGDKKPDLFKSFKKKPHSGKHTTDASQDASFTTIEIGVTDLKDVLRQKRAQNTTPAQAAPAEPKAFVSQVRSFEEDVPAVPLYELKPQSSAKTISKEEIMREIREKARAEARSSYANVFESEMEVKQTETVAVQTPPPAKIHETFDKITAQETPLKETVYTPEAEVGTITVAVQQTPDEAEKQAPTEAAEIAVQAEEASAAQQTPTETEAPAPAPDFPTVFSNESSTTVRKTGFVEAARSFIAYAKAAGNRRAVAVFSSVIAALIFVGTFTANFSFAYAARVNGQYVGVVSDKSQCEAVITEINNVLELNFGAAEKIDHHVSVSPRIIVKDNYTPEAELRSAIYALSDKMLEMHVIYAGETPVCAVGSAEAANNVLTEFELFYTNGDADTQFSTSVPLTVRQELAPVTLLCDVGEALNIMNGTQKKEGEYVVKSGDTLWAIARNYSTSVDDLISLNPTKGEEINIGDTLRVMAYAPVVTVTTVKRVEYDETIDYTTEVIETEDLYRGNSKITQKGVDGERHVTADLVKVNGLEVRRDIIEETVTQEPVTQIKTVGIAEPPKGYGTGSFSKPCSGTITSYFGTRRSGYHKGIDIANSYGTPIRAADNGRVIFAGWDNTGFGRLVKLDHQNGYISYYGHNSRIVVKVGQAVNKGDIIAYMGSTGNSTGNHCHFELYYNGRLLNPYSYIF